MRALVTGGAGFIGRWVVAELLRRGVEVSVVDNLRSGRWENLAEFQYHPGLSFRIGDIRHPEVLAALFATHPQVCLHLAASINVQDSLDDPRDTFENDLWGTFEVLEAARQTRTKVVYASTCLVYAAASEGPIAESHPTKPASPYAAAKLGGEQLALSYYYGYGLPVVVARPFNTYGPFQKSSGEGGVVAIFLNKELRGESLLVFGDGEQTRDLLYAEDCARFLVEAALSPAADGRLINAGSGQDISINQLAHLICPNPARIVHDPHPHPQAEIHRLRADCALAKAVLGWEPQVSLEEGLARTRAWLEKPR